MSINFVTNGQAGGQTPPLRNDRLRSQHPAPGKATHNPGRSAPPQLAAWRGNMAGRVNEAKDNLWLCGASNARV